MKILAVRRLPFKQCDRISIRQFPPVKAKLARNKSIIFEPIIASSHRGCLGSPEITLQAIAFSLENHYHFVTKQSRSEVVYPN
jgi:hypothetical protein